MIEHLNEAIGWPSLLWLFPVLFMFHDFEEILTVEAWAVKHRDKVLPAMPPFARKALSASFNCDTRQFAQDVLYVFTVIVASTVLAVFFSFYLPFLAALSLFFIHSFTHAFQALYLKMYTPGVWSAVLIALPYSAYTFYRYLAANIVDWADIGQSLILLAIAGPPLLWLLLKGRAKAAGQ
ncbi:Protein of unknown function with HXXEE motif-containing protein [Paenibacillus sophorae]|uniref:HXXEE domain-containing protein n=1 Tax=Paenibacillus sophorae TaxID=1333845 RepID=A0A1H8K1T2_9BACL|nr:HXXEE domain-containing protein [Paenibacillus sophorae]SEN86930.1 Protein of unknown function with HXXEE motif-containing protein [Paenibacillus sophorae]